MTPDLNALQRSEQRYRRIFESAGVSIWEEDFTEIKTALDDLRAKGVGDFRTYLADHPEFVEHAVGLIRVVDVNEATLRMFGADDKNQLRRPLASLLGAQAPGVFVEELVALAEGRPHFDAEARLRTLQNEPVDVMVSITFPAPGEPFEGVLLSVTDITRRREMERALRERETVFHEMADTAPALLWTTNREGVCTFRSRRWLEFAGQSAEKALGSGWLDAVHPADRDHVRERFADAGAAREPFELEYRVKRAEGDYRWVLDSGRPRVDAAGAFDGYVGAVIDITERRIAEDALTDEVDLRETLARVGATLAAELDPQKLVQAITDVATTLTTAEFGAFFYSVADQAGDAYQLCAVSGASKDAFADFPNPQATALLGQTFRGERTLRIADVTEDARYGHIAPHHRVPDGRLPVRSYMAVPIVLPSGQVLGGLFLGHSRPGVFLAKHEQLATGTAAWAGLALDNARLYEIAQDANRLKDEFLATLSHELRTPLNAILGWTYMLRSNTLPADTRGRALESLERNARVQAQLVDDLLDLSRIISGKLRIKTEAVDLAGVISAAVETIRPAAVSKGVDVEVRIDAEKLLVTGDFDRLQQVVWNLLSNAIKFTPNGGRVAIILRRKASKADIVVADTGQGIAPEFLPHVFERFRQADSSAARMHGGLGLGLAIVRHLAEAHGAVVSAESPGPGHGATFTVTLPIRAVKELPDRANGAAHARGYGLLGTRVLVVDDEMDARELIRALLESRGAQVTAAGSAGEALLRLQQQSFDVLLADLAMPRQDGYALIHAVRSLPADEGGRVPAIAVTAYAGTRERDSAIAAGYDWHVAKPVDPDRLIALVERAIKQPGPRGHNGPASILGMRQPGSRNWQV